METATKRILFWRTWAPRLACLGAAAVAIAATVVGYQDWQARGSAPANPGTGYFRTWADNSSGLMKCITSTGASCFFNPPASGSPLVLKTNGVNNGSQSILNLANGSGMTISDNGSGTITFVSSGGAGLTLQTNTVNNGSQTLLNLVQGAGITLADNGSGNVTITSSASGPMRAIGMAFGVTGGSAIAATETQYVTVPFGCTIKQWDMTVDAGTATVDIWKIAGAPADWQSASGTVNTVGTNVTWVSGTTFPTDAAGLHITINSVPYVIASITSSTALVLTTSAGTQSGVAFSSPAGGAVPTVANTITGSALPAIASGTAKSSTTLTGWTTAVVKNDILGFNVQAAATAQALSIVLECQQ